MPKNTVSDPITDQEMAYAHLIMSGTMTDRRAAEAVGLNPETAAYTKAKPRVRAYMMEHRAAVREKLVDQEADGLRKLNIGRDQILDRLPAGALRTNVVQTPKVREGMAMGLAGIGAGVGSAVGLATVLMTRGKEVELPQGATLDVVFDRAVAIE